MNAWIFPYGLLTAVVKAWPLLLPWPKYHRSFYATSLETLLRYVLGTVLPSYLEVFSSPSWPYGGCLASLLLSVLCTWLLKQWSCKETVRKYFYMFLPIQWAFGYTICYIIYVPIYSMHSFGQTIYCTCVCVYIYTVHNTCWEDVRIFYK